MAKKNYNREATLTAIDDLKPHPKNYRTHPEDQIDHIVQSIKEHGFYRNVVVAKDGTILAGHGVVIAAKQLNMTEIPVVKLNITSNTPKALKLLAADNFIQHRALDDDRQLTELLKQISETDDLLGTGFDESALAAYVMVSRSTDEIEGYDAATEWANAGMPEFENPNTLDEFTEEAALTIKFPSEKRRDEWVANATANDAELIVIVKRQGMWTLRWPASESPDAREDLRSVKFVSEIHD